MLKHRKACRIFELVGHKSNAFNCNFLHFLLNDEFPI